MYVEGTVKHMTLQQKDHNRTDQTADDETRITIDSPLTNEEKKNRFIQSAGKIQIDAAVVNNLRERSMV